MRTSTFRQCFEQRRGHQSTLGAADVFTADRVASRSLRRKDLGSLAVAVALMAYSNPCAAQSWSSAPDMPTARTGPAVCAVDGFLYAIGGGTSSGTLNTVERYDPSSGTWSARAGMPTARWGAGCGVVDDKIYVVGGSRTASTDGVSLVEMYDPATDSWSPVSSRGPAHIGQAVVAVGGRIYVASNVLSEYDPITDTWTGTSAAPDGNCFNFPGAAAMDGKIYLAGSDEICIYEPGSDSWTLGAAIPSNKSAVSMSEFQGKLHLMGGMTASSAVQVYDPATDTWELKLGELPTSRAFVASEVVDRAIYAVGGQRNAFLSSVSAVVEVFSSDATNTDQSADLPATFVLLQNYPNPFNPSTAISFTLPHSSNVTLKVVDVQGRRLRDLALGFKEPGTHEVVFDAIGLSSGTYFYQLQAGRVSETRPMVVLK
ncbi:MAG: T9SS type A sorting domain-containing protein [Rhodothermales bacterium]|nr:T9SS type A sorting domain-containing protein [Rhodothermales bacterium]